MSEPTDEWPLWVDAWCREHLGAPPARLLHRSDQMSSVLGLRLADGVEVALKWRESEGGREAACIAAQTALARQGLPVAEPLTGVAVDEAGLAVHAERWSPQGALLRGDSPREARLSARVLAHVVGALADVRLPTEPDPPPYWLSWAYPDADPWPVKPWLTARDASLVPPWINDTARRATARILDADLPRVLGHGDWEAQNLRWTGTVPAVVHDWDSLARLPEAALAGAAAGAFASAEVPTLAPLSSSRAFLESYQDTRGRWFSAEEERVAWAASLWPAAHNARAEALFGSAPSAGRPLAEQHVERLRLAGA